MDGKPEPRHTEVLIAGTGPAGCTFARFLAPHKQVWMVEAGGHLSKRAGAHLKNSFVYQRDVNKFTPIVQGLLQQISVPPRTNIATALDPIAYPQSAGSIRSAMNPRQDPYRNLEAAAVSYAVGGMLTHWTNNTPRHHPTLEMIPFIPGGDWNVLYPYAEALLNAHTDVFEHSVRNTLVKKALSDYYRNELPAAYPVQNLPVAGERLKQNDELVHYSASDTILGNLADQPPSDRFQILPQHRVKKLVTKKGKFEYAVVEDLINWKTYHIYADIVIVAAGAIMTPQILWNSHIRPYALGRYLFEHPMTFTQIVLKKEIVDSIMDVEEIQRDEVSRRRLAGRSPNDPIPIPMNDPPPMVWIPVCEAVSQKRLWHCQIHRDSFSYGAVPPDIDDRLIVDLRWFGMVDPVPSNLVRFEEDLNDKFGMPQPTFEYTLGEDDRRRAHDMMSDMVDAAQALGGFLPGSEPRFMPPGTSLHLQGTSRMGEKNDGTCITDSFSKLWEYDNVYLGGNGLIPTRNASNPTLTTVALATRAAHKILGVVPQSPPVLP